MEKQKQRMKTEMMVTMDGLGGTEKGLLHSGQR